MTQKQVYDTIEKAIDNKTELLLTVKHGLGSSLPGTAFHAYLLGDDTYQYAFAWGYLPDQGLYYKFMLSMIEAAKPTPTHYAVREDACYQHALEEDHFSRLEGFDNIYTQAARHAGK